MWSSLQLKCACTGEWAARCACAWESMPSSCAPALNQHHPSDCSFAGAFSKTVKAGVSVKELREMIPASTTTPGWPAYKEKGLLYDPTCEHRGAGGIECCTC
jgi:hypothetical protein